MPAQGAQDAKVTSAIVAAAQTCALEGLGLSGTLLAATAVAGAGIATARLVAAGTAKACSLERLRLSAALLVTMTLAATAIAQGCLRPDMHLVLITAATAKIVTAEACVWERLRQSPALLGAITVTAVVVGAKAPATGAGTVSMCPATRAAMGAAGHNAATGAGHYCSACGPCCAQGAGSLAHGVPALMAGAIVAAGAAPVLQPIPLVLQVNSLATFATPAYYRRYTRDVFLCSWSTLLLPCLADTAQR